MATSFPTTASIQWTALPNANVSGANGSMSAQLTDTLLNSAATTQAQKYQVKAIEDGCASDPVLFTANILPALVAQVSPGIQTICSGDSATILITTNQNATSQANYTVGSTFNVQGAFNGTGSVIKQRLSTSDSATGSVLYHIVASNNSCQSDTVTALVSIKALPKLQIQTISNSICQYDTLTALASASTDSTTVQWALANSADWQVISNLNGVIKAIALQAGTQSISVSADRNGCTSTLPAVSITVKPAPQKPVITVNGRQQFCAGDSAILQTPAITPRQWFVDGSAIAAPAGTQANLTVKTQGLYTVTTSSPNGCSSLADSVNIIVNSLPEVPVISGRSRICLSDSTLLTSSDSANTLLWRNGGTILSGAVNRILLVRGPGSYTVVSTTAQGCSANSTIFSVVQDSIKAIATAVQANCKNPALVYVTVSGTTNTYQVNWSGPDGSIITDTISPAPAGTYQAVVTDSISGCAVKTLPITVLPFTPLELTVAQRNPTTCNSTDGRIKGTTNLVGSIITIHNGASVIASDSASNLPAGMYHVIASNGPCRDTLIVSLSNPVGLDISISRTLPQPCRNIDGTVKVSLTGQPADSVKFKTAPGIAIISQGDSISGLSPGLYKAVAYRGGCSDSAEFSIAVPDNFNVSASTTPSECGQATGAINLQLTGSFSLDSIVIRNGGNLIYKGTNTQLTNLASGQYQVTAYEGSCVKTLVADVVDSLTFTASATNTTTCLSSDGSLSISGIANGTSVNWYLVTTGKTLVGSNAILQNRAPGTYLAIVSNGNCIDSATVNISRPDGCDPNCKLRLVASSTPVSCFGGADGEALGLTLNAGTRKVEYRLGNQSWERVDSLYKRFTSLAAGLFSISVRDSIDTMCVAQTSFNIGTRVSLITTLNLRNADCGNDRGSVQFTVAGGLAPYSYSVDSGRTFRPLSGSTTVVQLAIGQYHFQVRDASPCISPAQAFRIEGSLPVKVAFETVNTTCNGDNTGGFKIINIQGDTAAEYKVGNAPYQLIRPGSVVTGLPAGNVTILFRSLTGQCVTDTTITIQQSTALSATIQVQKPADCGLSNGILKVTSISGGSSTYRLRLTAANNSIVYQGNLPADSLLNNMAGGAYALAIFDSSGCKDSITVQMPENRTPFTGIISINKPLACAADTVVYKLLSGTNSIQRQWIVNGLAVVGATLDSFSIKASQVNSIAIMVTSTSDCISGLPLLIKGQNPTLLSTNQPLTAQLTSIGTMACKGSQVELKASASPSLPGTNYAFMVNGQTIRQSQDSLLTLAVDSLLYAQVVATNTENSCLVSSTDSSNVITISPIDSLSVYSTVRLNSAGDSIACAGKYVGIKLQTNIGSMGGVSYQWLMNGQRVTGSADSLFVTAVDTTMLVSAIVTGPSGQACLRNNPDTTQPVSIRFRKNSDPLCLPCQVVARVDTIINNTCTGQFNGEVRFAIAGGTGAYEVEVLGYRPYLFTSSKRASNLPSGIYTFVVRDTMNRNCTDTLENVAVNTLYNLNATIQTVRPTQCNGAANGEIRITQISGGFGPFKTKIRSADTLSDQLIYTNLRSGIYSLTLMDDSTGCQFTSPVTIDTNLPLQVFATALRTPSCYGDREFAFTIDSIKNGNPAYQISAVNADTGYQAILLQQPIVNQSATSARTFYVKDGNGCKTSLIFSLPVRDSLQLAVTVASASECFAPTGKLKILEVNGGTGHLQVTVENLNRLTIDTLLTLPADSILGNLEAGAYKITLSDTLGCSKTMIVSIPGNNPRAANIVVKNVCPGQSNGLIQLHNLNGGTRPFDFTLTRSDGFQRMQRDSLFASLSTGIYTITITDSSMPQCRSVYTREVKVIDSLRIDVIGFKPSTCSNVDGEVRFKVVGGQPGYSYSVDSAQGVFKPFVSLAADSGRVTGLTARSLGQLHTLKVTDASPEGGCTVQTSFQLPGNTPLTYEHNLNHVNCYGDSTGQLQLFNLKGTGPVIVEAFKSGSGELIASDSIRVSYFNMDAFNLGGMTSGAYNFQVRQYGACAGAQVFSGTIPQNAQIILHARNTYGSAPEYPEGEIELDSARGGRGALQYSFDGSPMESFSDGIWKKNLAPGNYQVILQDSLGCRVTYNLEVYRDSVFAIPNVFTPDGDGKNDMWVIKNLPSNSKLTIANRWGRNVYEARPYQNNFDAHDVPNGTYLYTLEMPDGTKRSGWVDIIK